MQASLSAPVPAVQAPRRRCARGCPPARAQATGPGAGGRARARQPRSPHPSLHAAAQRAPNRRTPPQPPRRRGLCSQRTRSRGAWPRQGLQRPGARHKRGPQPRRRLPRPSPARQTRRLGPAGPQARPQASRGPRRPRPAGRAACARSCSRPPCRRPPASAPSGARAALAVWRTAAPSRRGRLRPREARRRRACLQRAR